MKNLVIYPILIGCVTLVFLIAGSLTGYGKWSVVGPSGSSHLYSFSKKVDRLADDFIIRDDLIDNDEISRILRELSIEIKTIREDFPSSANSWWLYGYAAILVLVIFQLFTLRKSK